jgi:hypothetical protein
MSAAPSQLGLAIIAGLIMADIAASIFLDAANVFQLFLPLFGRSRDWAAA